MNGQDGSANRRSVIVSRPLGQTGRRVSSIGLGCASFWARPGFDDARARAVLERALEAGINLFDTGASYAGGHAEQRLGRLLRQIGADPHELLVGTKAGTVADARGRLRKDFDPDSITQQVTQSLSRLGMERLPLLQLHGPSPADLGEPLLRRLENLRSEGRVERIGINGSAEAVAAGLEHCVFDVLMPFVSVREPGNRALVRTAALAGRGVLVAGPLARMTFAPPLAEWLTRPSGLWYLARALRHQPASLLRSEGLRSALKFPGWTPAQLAMRWVLDQPGVACAVFGTTRPDHVTELAACVDRPLPDEVRDALNRLLGPGPDPIPDREAVR